MLNLEQAQKIAEGASYSSGKMNSVIQSLSSYRRYVVGASPSKVVQLQENLINNLKGVSYNTECYQREMATFKFVAQGCKYGKGSLKDLVNQAMLDFDTNDDACKDESGLPYTSENDVKQFVAKKAEKEKFEEDCLLNSGLKQKVVCEDYNEGFTVSEIIANSKLDKETVKKYEESCPLPRLSPSDEESICLLKPFKTALDVQAMFADIDKMVIKKIYIGCAST